MPLFTDLFLENWHLLTRPRADVALAHIAQTRPNSIPIRCRPSTRQDEVYFNLLEDGELPKLRFHDYPEI